MREAGGFEIDVEPRYLPGESDPNAHRWVFAYTITVKNCGAAAAQLRHRHWLITDADGQRQEVRGRGVVGKEPRLKPGESFRYTSAAVLETPFGTMQGDYEFEADDGHRFVVPIPVFALSVPNLVH